MTNCNPGKKKYVWWGRGSHIFKMQPESTVNFNKEQFCFEHIFINIDFLTIYKTYASHYEKIQIVMCLYLFSQRKSIES